MSDWDRETVLRKPKPRVAVIRTQGELNAAARQGAIVETLRGSKVANKAHHVDTDHRRIAQLDRKAIPNQQILTKIERVLEVKLRGKDIGAPLPLRGSKAKAAEPTK
ncbi:multiprotein-bridging factor 1 [Coemansia sp. RSA 2673]|nr:multiprotein-bridging factor 1 [Coemansia sp. RSA 2673]